MSIKIDPVSVVRSVRPSENEPVPTEVSWTFDFEGVTKERLVSLAVESLVIKAQTRFRKAFKKGESGPLVKKTWKVAEDFGTATRERISKVEKARRLGEDMTPEQRAAAIAELQAMLEGGDE